MRVKRRTYGVSVSVGVACSVRKAYPFRICLEPTLAEFIAPIPNRGQAIQQGVNPWSCKASFSNHIRPHDTISQANDAPVQSLMTTLPTLWNGLHATEYRGRCAQ